MLPVGFSCCCIHRCWYCLTCTIIFSFLDALPGATYVASCRDMKLNFVLEGKTVWQEKCLPAFSCSKLTFSSPKLSKTFSLLCSISVAGQWPQNIFILRVILHTNSLIRNKKWGEMLIYIGQLLIEHSVKLNPRFYKKPRPCENQMLIKDI